MNSGRVIARRVVLVVLAATALCRVTPVRAGPVNLRWNACFGDGGVMNRTFACDTNLGSERLVVSFILPSAVDSVTSLELILNLRFAGTTTPPWWSFDGAGVCRPGSLSVGSSLPPGASACVDWADGTGAYWIYDLFPSSARIHVWRPLVPGPSAFDLVAGQEYFAMSVAINHQKTVGSGACSGCAAGGCFGVRSILLHQPSTDTEVYFGGSRAESDAAQVLWQNGTGVAMPNYGGAGFTLCLGVTDARRSTWGEVKSLYR